MGHLELHIREPQERLQRVRVLPEEAAALQQPVPRAEGLVDGRLRVLYGQRGEVLAPEREEQLGLLAAPAHDFCGIGWGGAGLG